MWLQIDGHFGMRNNDPFPPITAVAEVFTYVSSQYGSPQSRLPSSLVWLYASLQSRPPSSYVLQYAFPQSRPPSSTSCNTPSPSLFRHFTTSCNTLFPSLVRQLFHVLQYAFFLSRPPSSLVLQYAFSQSRPPTFFGLIPSCTEFGRGPFRIMLAMQNRKLAITTLHTAHLIFFHTTEI